MNFVSIFRGIVFEFPYNGNFLSYSLKLVLGFFIDVVVFGIDLYKITIFEFKIGVETVYSSDLSV